MAPQGLAKGSGAEQQAAAGGGGASTVAQFVTKHGGPQSALRKYIASFSGGADAEAGELGKRPPCRSYRSLRLLAELHGEIEGRLKMVRYKDFKLTGEDPPDP